MDAVGAGGGMSSSAAISHSMPAVAWHGSRDRRRAPAVRGPFPSLRPNPARQCLSDARAQPYQPVAPPAANMLPDNGVEPINW